jgi:lipid-A-disaccharide synthase
MVRYPKEMGDLRDASGLLPVSMVNLIAGRRVVPELLQDNFTAANVASALAPLLVDSPEREAQVAALADVRHRLQAPTPADAIDRLANAVEAALA